MGSIRKHSPVKLVIGLIYKEDEAFTHALRALKRFFGDIDFETRALAFDHTDYYQKEFGPQLKRKFISFRKLVLPQQLSAIKIKTNKLESRLSLKGLRRVNIDPGYLDLSKFILATTKDFRHRIYIGEGIFAEMTLYYQDKTFRPWAWTYPDYKNSDHITIFNQLREIYRRQL